MLFFPFLFVFMFLVSFLHCNVTFIEAMTAEAAYLRCARSL